MGKNIRNSVILILTLLALIISCGGKKTENGKNKSENTGTQNSQSEKTASKYNKVVVLDPAIIEMMYLLEIEDKIIGVSNMERTKIWPEDKVSKLESVGTFIKPSLEKIISLKPDLVIASFHTASELDNGLKSAGIEIMRFQANSVEEIFKNFQEIGQLFGKEEEANKIIAEKKIKLEEIKKIEKKERKGLFVLSVSPLMSFGKGTLPNDIMKLLNIKNISESLEGASPTVTAEYIIKENPEIIMTMIKNPEEIKIANPALDNVTAVKENRFIVVDSSQILRGSPRTIDYIIDVYEKTKK